MKKTSFHEYLIARAGRRLVLEMDEKGGDQKEKSDTAAVSSTITLGKDNDFKPFIVTDDPRNPAYPSNRNLAPIVRAFLESPKVKVYNSLTKDGESKPHTLPQKKLYMVGGPVRDHMRGLTPKDIDLVTDATPDEIRMILTDSGFKETDAKQYDDATGDPKKAKAPRSSDHGDKIFYVKGRDKAGTDFVFGVKVNGQEFDLATFRKDGHSSDQRTPDQMQFASHKEDAARRDLTINSMYLTLNNPDGPNATVTDFHGGAHDLIKKKVRWVGKAQDRLDEDLLRALRFIRFVARYGNGDAEEGSVTAIKKVAPQIRKAVSAERIQDEFSKGLAYEDVDPAVYIKLYKDMGLLDVVFPGMHFKLESPDDYPKDRDKAVVIASLLRGNDPQAVKQCLVDGKWSGQDTKRVMFLLKILDIHPHLDPEELDQYLHQYQSSGIQEKGLSSWWDANKKGNPELMRAFLNHAKGERVRTVHTDPETGHEGLHPAFADIMDPETRKAKEGVHPSEIGRRRREEEHRNWRTGYEQLQPRARPRS